MGDLEVRIYNATMSLLAAKHPAVRMDRLAILQSLERAATYTFTRFLSIALAQVDIDPDGWAGRADAVRQLFVLIYRRRLMTLEELLEQDIKKGIRATHSPIYHLIVAARGGLRRVSPDDELLLHTYRR